MDLSLLDQHQILYESLIGEMQTQNREIKYVVSYGKDSRPSSLRPGREFARVEISTRNFYGNIKNNSWFYHFDGDHQYMTSISLRGMAFKHINIQIISFLENLAYIDLQGNQLEKFDWAIIKQLKYLHTLNLSSNKIKSIENDFIYLPGNLRYLNLYNNEIKAFNMNCLGNCVNINRINLGSNKISNINLNSIQSKKYLSILDLSHNNLDKFDLDFETTYLKYLYLNDNKIKYFGIDTFADDKLPNINQIDLYNNNIEFLDFSIILCMRSIKKILAWGNNLVKVDLICYHSVIVELYLNSNNITDLHISGDFYNLEILELGYNQISELNLMNAHLNSLKELNLCLNPLIDLKFDVSALPCIELIDISGTQIKDIKLEGSELLNESEIYVVGDLQIVEVDLCINGNCYKIIKAPEVIILL